MNTDKAYIMGLVTGGGSFSADHKSFSIRLPYKQWGDLSKNPERAGMIATDILKVVRPLMSVEYELDVSYTPGKEWFIACHGDTKKLIADLRSYGIEPTSDLHKTADLSKLIDALTDTNMKKRYIAGVADTIGSMAPSHRRFSDDVQIISFEISGFNYKYVCQLCNLLYSLGCVPDQILWQHPNMQSGTDSYYSSWKKGNKLRVTLDSFNTFGSLAFKSKSSAAKENRLRETSGTYNAAIQCEEKKLSVPGVVAVHVDENYKDIPCELRGGHFIHHKQICAALDCPHAPRHELDSLLAHAERYVSPFAVLHKDDVVGIAGIIDRDPILKNRSYVTMELKVKELVDEANDGAATFEEVEQRFYSLFYRESVEAQNERNIQNRHPERNRSTDDLLHDKRTCPEESILQIGNIDESVDGEMLVKIACAFFAEMENRFGDHIHFLDWSLHMGEGTPHIHERHVFDADDGYGHAKPQQEKALEALGIELPDPSKKSGKNNNRKMTFDKICRDLFLEICEKHDLYVDRDPTYGGRTYLEKQEYIIMAQKQKLAELEAELQSKTLQIQDVDAIDDMFSDLNSNAYNANVSYKDNYIEVSGKVSEIDPNGEYFILVSDAAEGEQVVKCIPTGAEALSGLTEISIGGRAVVSGKVTEVDVEKGFSLDVSSVAVDDSVYANFLDRDQLGIVQYKIPQDWKSIESSVEEDGTSQIRYTKEDDKENVDGKTYVYGMAVYTVQFTSEEAQAVSELSDDQFADKISELFCILAEIEDEDVADNVKTGLRTVQANGVDGLALKYQEGAGIYDEMLFWASDEKAITVVIYETDLSDPEFDKEAQLVLESLTFPKGISFKSSNGTADMELTGADSVFGTRDEILSGNSKDPADQEKTTKESDENKESDSEDKTKMASIYDEGNTITLEQYNKIKEGMTYQQVVDIVGSEGSLTVNSSAGGISIEMYTWVSDNSYGLAEIGFQDGKVISMTQFGLE